MAAGPRDVCDLLTGLAVPRLPFRRTHAAQAGRHGARDTGGGAKGQLCCRPKSGARPSGRADAERRSLRERALESAAIAGEREANRYKVGRALRSLVVRPVYAAAMSLGVHPYAPLFALRSGRRGNLVSAIRRRTGLEKLTR